MTFRPRLSPFLLLALALGAFAGCSEDNKPTVPNVVSNQADADDVAFQAGIAFDNLTSEFQASAGAPSGPVFFRTPMATTSGGGGFLTASDTSFTRGSITFQLSRRWFSVAHVEQTVPDATTDSLVVTTRASGVDSTSTVRYRVAVGHAGQLRVGGLVAARPIYTIAATASDTLDSRFTSLSGGLTRTFYAWLFGVAAGIEIPKASPTGYPTTGTIRWVIHAERTRSGDRGNVEKTLDATVLLTFNGTRYPTLTVNGTWGYVLDLDTGAVTRGGGA